MSFGFYDISGLIWGVFGGPGIPTSSTTGASLSATSTVSTQSIFSRTTLLSIDSDGGADEIEWQIYSLDGDIGYPIVIRTSISGITQNYTNVTDSGLIFIEIELPPNQRFKFRIRRHIGGEYESWSEFQNFTSMGYLNSYQKYLILSGLPIS